MAATHDRTTSFTVSTDAALRAWIDALHNAIIAAGLVQTSDTGQIDRATVVRGAVDAVLGYEVFRFNDSEQATNPIFLKVSYGMGDTTSIARVGYEVGRGSSGTGTITTSGLTLSSTSAGNVDSAARLIHVGGGNGHLIIMVNSDGGAGDSMNVLIEREKDGDGAYTGRVFAFGNMGNATPLAAVWTGSVWTAITMNVAASSPAIVMPGLGASPSGRVPVGTIYFGGQRSPLRTLLVVMSTAAADDETGTIEIDGVTRSYVAYGLISFWNSGTTSQVNVFLGSASASGTLRALLLNE